MGAVIGVTLDIYEWSTPEDRQILIEAFTKGQNQGLVNALSKMKAVGHCAITGTIGYDVELYPHGSHSNRQKDRICD